ncbi:MAG: thiamine pyrophosphate-dependent enzyme [Acidobacteriota bacterium]
MNLSYEKLIRYEMYPVYWCPGCGIGVVFKSILISFDKLGWDPNEIAFISGIGCTSRMPGYLKANTIHTTHGRALTFATGIKLVKPDKKVVVVSGDGDALAIGGNHFLHACRRNIDIKLIIVNNGVYGMTGGQVSPTTPEGFFTETTPYGNIDPEFDTVKIAEAAGATYVARESVTRPFLLSKIIEKSLSHKGFAVVEVISNCHINLGRKNKMRNQLKMLKWIDERIVPLSKASSMTPEELKGKLVTGEFVNKQKPEYVEQYYTQIIGKVKELQAEFDL